MQLPHVVLAAPPVNRPAAQLMQSGVLVLAAKRPGAHASQDPPGGPLYPFWQRQLVAGMLVVPVVFECGGQSVHGPLARSGV